MIDVVQEGVERTRPLADALVQHAPFLAGEDARQQVEGDQPFRIAALAINGEGDADAPEDRLRLIHPTIESGNARPLHPVLHFRVTGAYRTVRSEEHTSELQSLMRISYSVFRLQKKIKNTYISTS